MPDRDTLAADNAPELAKMNRDAAGIVQGLFIECADAGTLISLSNAVQGGTQVDAEVVSGDPAVMTRKAAGARGGGRVRRARRGLATT